MYLKAPETRRAYKRAFPRDNIRKNFPELSTLFTKPIRPPNASFLGASHQCRLFQLILCLQLLRTDGESVNMREGKKGVSPLILADVSARLPRVSACSSARHRQGFDASLVMKAGLEIISQTD